MTPTPTTINFKKIHGVDSHILNVIADKMNRQRYNTHDGYGYVVKSQDDSHVLGYLIIDYPTYIMEFDMDEMATKKIKTMKKLAIEFLIDLNKQDACQSSFLSHGRVTHQALSCLTICYLQPCVSTIIFIVIVLMLINRKSFY